MKNFFNGHTKCWLILVKDVESMYKSLITFLWYEGKGSDNVSSPEVTSKKAKVNQRHEREEAIDYI